MTIIEAIAVFFGLLCVWLVVKQSIWCWPTGLIQVSLYIFIFYDVKLYSDLILHIFYVGMNIYGWYYWLHGGKNQASPPVTRLQGQWQYIWPVTALVGTLIWGYSMSSLTDADVPYGDAFTTVSSLIAQWLMARKKLESWVFWIIVDIVAIGIYWYKSLFLTSGLYAAFLVLSIIGFMTWRKSMQQPKDQTPTDPNAL